MFIRYCITHWGWDKMAAISQTTFSNVFSWMNMYKFCLSFHWSFFIPALVQIMAWCRPGNKPLSEPMMLSLLMHICITRPQCVKDRVPGCSTNNGSQCEMPYYNIIITYSITIAKVEQISCLNSPKTSHNSPSWVSYGISIVSIL